MPTALVRHAAAAPVPIATIKTHQESQYGTREVDISGAVIFNPTAAGASYTFRVLAASHLLDASGPPTRFVFDGGVIGGDDAMYAAAGEPTPPNPPGPASLVVQGCDVPPQRLSLMPHTPLALAADVAPFLPTTCPNAPPSHIAIRRISLRHASSGPFPAASSAVGLAVIRFVGELPRGSSVAIEGLVAVGHRTEVLLDSLALFDGSSFALRDSTFDHCAYRLLPAAGGPVDWEAEDLSYAVRSSSRIGASAAVGVGLIAGGRSSLSVAGITVRCGAIAAEVAHVGGGSSVAVSNNTIADAHAGIVVTVTGRVDDGASLTTDNNTVTASPDVISKKLVGVQIAAPAGPMLITRGSLVGARRNTVRHRRPDPAQADAQLTAPFFRRNPREGLHVGVEASAVDFIITDGSALDVSGNAVSRENAVAVQHVGVAVVAHRLRDSAPAFYAYDPPRHRSPPPARRQRPRSRRLGAHR